MGDKSAARPPEGCPAEAGGLFGPESALGFEHPSGTNARRPSQKAGSLPMGYQVNDRFNAEWSPAPSGPPFGEESMSKIPLNIRALSKLWQARSLGIMCLGTWQRLAQFRIHSPNLWAALVGKRRVSVRTWPNPKSPLLKDLVPNSVWWERERERER